MWFLRMAKWARHPPSPRRVVLVLCILAACLALALAERAGVLPGWMALSPRGLRP
jgi:hypothetical protein